MPQKKSKPKAKETQAKRSAKTGTAPSKGVVGFFKKIVSTKPTASGGSAASKTGAAKPKAAPAPKPKPVAKPVKAQNGQDKTPVVVAPPGKKKPPSITITRPEVTRPPLVPMPVPKHEAPIGAPIVLQPKGGQSVNSLTPVFRWMYVGGATRYEVEWSHDAHFGRGHSSSLQSAQTLITLDPAHTLKPGAMVLWRVRAGNESGWGPWSGAESFKAPEK